MTADELSLTLRQRAMERGKARRSLRFERDFTPVQEEISGIVQVILEREVNFLMKLAQQIEKEGIHPGDVTPKEIEASPEDDEDDSK